jgi:hypothetical protein
MIISSPVLDLSSSRDSNMRFSCMYLRKPGPLLSINFYQLPISRKNKSKNLTPLARSHSDDSCPCTDKKENQIFLICKEIQIHSEWSSCKAKYEEGFPNEMRNEEMRKYFPIYEEAVIHI